MLRHFFAIIILALASHYSSAITFLVTTNGDSGPGSLRQAILDANATPGRDEIHFSIGSGPATIEVLSWLPAITDAVALNAATQPGYSNAPIVTLFGQGSAQTGPGLHLVNTGSSVIGLVIHGFRFSPGLLLRGGGGHVIAGCQIGSLAQFANANGIVLSNSVGNQIGLPGLPPNVIIRNLGAGILLAPLSSNNVIQGNYIGTDTMGSTVGGNQSDGIRLGGADYNTIGGMTAGDRNVIAGNGGNGILFHAANFNVIEGNHIGCDSMGVVSIPNRLCGVNVLDSSDNTIGGIAAAARNLISGNTVHGIEIAGFASVNTIVQGNYIGTAASGTAALANGGSGVFLNNTVDNLIGGVEAGAGNVISGNAGSGVTIGGGNGNIIQGNLVGLDHSGNVSLGNANGIYVSDSPENLIGGTDPSARNIISGNTGEGVAVVGFGASSANLILGNYIGTDSSGAAAIPNRRGLLLSGSSPNNLIQSNLVSGNLAQGISVGGYSNVVVGNFVGTDASGHRTLANGAAGIAIGLIGNTIGGVEPGSRNVISGNGGHGVEVHAGSAAASYGHVIQGNFIGLDVSGTAALPNGGFGIVIGAYQTTIGGAEPGAGNVISGNSAGGVSIGLFDDTIGFSAPRTNVLHGNRIGTDALGMFGVPNRGPGVLMVSPARNNFIGGPEPGEANVIAFNIGDGVLIVSNSTGNAVLGNSIHSNGRLGINLKPNNESNGAVTANDIVDADAGANNLQNFPVITNIVYLSSSTIVQGYLHSSTNGSFAIDVYANVATESSGHGEGEFHLGSVDVDTDESGLAEFSFVASAAYSNQFFTATALNYATGDTSEFSAAMGGVRITRIQRVANQYRISFTTITNRNYFLEYTTNLNAPVTWSNVVVPPTPGTGGEVIVPDIFSGTNPMRIYRVHQLP